MTYDKNPSKVENVYLFLASVPSLSHQLVLVIAVVWHGVLQWLNQVDLKCKTALKFKAVHLRGLKFICTKDCIMILIKTPLSEMMKRSLPKGLFCINLSICIYALAKVCITLLHQDLNAETYRL